MLLSIAVICYILSLVTALVLLLLSKRMNPGWFRMVGGIHIVLGVFFLFTHFTYKGEIHLAFLFFFCSGIVASGITFGMNKALPFRIYFGVYSASILVFILSPSTMLNFLIAPGFTTGNEKMIPVSEKYFLEIQSTLNKDSINAIEYKLIRKTGMFHQTIMRNINFNGRLDSIKVLDYREGIAVELRGYTSRKTFVNDEIDSTDVSINLNPTGKDVIERKL
jgi:hypothetical protein